MRSSRPPRIPPTMGPILVFFFFDFPVFPPSADGAVVLVAEVVVDVILVDDVDVEVAELDVEEEDEEEVESEFPFGWILMPTPEA
jgi:hypothetical protein